MQVGKQAEVLPHMHIGHMQCSHPCLHHNTQQALLVSCMPQGQKSSSACPVHTLPSCAVFMPGAYYLQVTDRTAAERLIIVAPQEWEAGKVRIKHLRSRHEEDLSITDLITRSTCS